MRLESLFTGGGLDGDDLSDALALLRELAVEARMSFTMRDESGRIVDGITSSTREEETREVERGDFVGGDHHRYYDIDGHELPRLRMPSQIARISGISQPNAVFAIRRPDGSEQWVQTSFIPIAQGREGWSVLSFGRDVSDLVAPRREAEERAELLDLLLNTSISLAGRRRGPEAMAHALQPAAGRLLPDARVTLSVRDGDRLRQFPIRAHPTLGPVQEFIALHDGVAARWGEPKTHLNLDVQDTDIYGNVVGAAPVPQRSALIVPVLHEDGRRLAALVGMSPKRHAFRPARVDAVEQLARIVGGLLELPEEAAGGRGEREPLSA